MQDIRLLWYGHVMGREEIDIGKKVMELVVDGTWNKGRPRRRCNVSVREDLKEKKLKGNDMWDTVKWKRLARNMGHVWPK